MDPVSSAPPPRDLTCEDVPPPPPNPQACDDFSDGTLHDFDHCITEDASNSALYLTQTGNVHAVAATDVTQGKVGDCALMATLVALASTPQGRAVLRSAIDENRNAQGQVVSYTVTLHKPETHALWFTTFSDVKVTVTPKFPVGHAEWDSVDGIPEIWTAVIEKALAQYVGGYNTLNQGCTANVPMALLTGRPAKCIPIAQYNPKQLKSDIGAGKLIVLETKTSFDQKNDGPDLIEAHAYCLTGTEMVKGELYVLLRNPWGSRQPPPIPYAQLSSWFSRVDTGSVVTP